MNYSIVPVPAYPSEAIQINLSDVRVILNESADCQWYLVDANGAQVTPSSRCGLTHEQYLLWGNDDTYFAQCITQNLGLQLAPAE